MACRVSGVIRGGTFLDQLLVPSLRRTFPLSEMDHVSSAVAQHLELDVAWLFEVLLHVHGVVAEGVQCFRAGHRNGVA